MIPTIQFDLGTLSIWTTTGTLSGEIAELAAEVMAAAARSEDPTPLIAAATIDDDVRRRMLFLASCVWHEKRHFFDTCISNYGARQFRDMFVLGANAFSLVANARERNEPVWFPAETYESPVLRKVFGISKPRQNVIEIARQARLKK
jgi:hypothetical protein